MKKILGKSIFKLTGWTYQVDPSILEKKQVIIGDRFQDIQSGVENNIASIWCAYGFGKPKEAIGSTTRIKEIRNLLDIL